jgi:hypothetical protein
VCHVNLALLLLNATPMDRRFPVLAVGSNAAPGQLRHKFRTGEVSNVVPVTRCAVRGLTVSHSPHVSNPGYIPYVPAADENARSSRFFVLWLDRHQIEAMNATEPNYDLVCVADYPLDLDSGDSIGVYSVYRGKWGALRLEMGSPRLPRMTQPALYGWLLGKSWFRALVPGDNVQTAISALRRDGSLRDEVRNEMARRRLIVSDGLQVSHINRQPYGCTS